MKIDEAAVVAYVEAHLEGRWEVFWGTILAQLRASDPHLNEEAADKLRKWVYAGYLEGFGDGGMCALEALRLSADKET